MGTKFRFLQPALADDCQGRRFHSPNSDDAASHPAQDHGCRAGQREIVGSGQCSCATAASYRRAYSELGWASSETRLGWSEILGGEWDPHDLASVLLVLEDFTDRSAGLRDLQSVASQASAWRYAGASLRMAFSLAAPCCRPTAGRVPYNPSGFSRIADQRFQSGTTSSGSSRSIRWPSAGRMVCRSGHLRLGAEIFRLAEVFSVMTI